MKSDRKRSVRSFEVARLAGVSRSAVSRAFTDGASISEDTRRKVFEAARRLGYLPNAIARTLITSRSNIVGVVASDILNPFYARVIESLSYALQDKGLNPLLFVSRDAHEIDDLIPRLLAYQVDGVIITAATLSSNLARACLEAGTPVVLVNRYVDFAEVSSVCCANIAGGAAVADHLLELGRRRIAFLAGIEDTSSSQDRERGFRQRLIERGVDRLARAVGHYTYKDALPAARSLLAAPRRPDAVFCANDVMALALIDVARNEFRLDVPNDLAVVGYDNIPAAAWPAYDLTSVDQDVDGMTAQAAEVLVARVRDPLLAPTKSLVSPRLIMRGSTRADR